MTYMIYGAYGYTGELIARAAVDRGHRPILAGRSPERLEALADELGCEARAFRLQDARIVETRLDEVDAVLHCAGPFRQTFTAVSKACFATGTHYLDITGEVEVFEALAAQDEAAKGRDIMLMPGVGFDIVPTDCLALHLKGRLPTADRLTLGIQAIANLSRGTALTAVENIHRGGQVRMDGRLRMVPAGWKSRRIDFGRGPVTAVTMPWADVASAYYSTGIPNIEVYMAISASQRALLRMSRHLGGFLGTSPMQAFLKSRVRSGSPGPTTEQRRRGRSRLWGEVSDADGGRASARMETPEGYTTTVLTAVDIVDRVIQGDAPRGFQTPAKAYGPDLILGIEGVTREDE